MDINNKKKIIELIKQYLPQEGLLLKLNEFTSDIYEETIFTKLEWINNEVIVSSYLGNTKKSSHLIDYSPLVELKLCFYLIIEKLVFI